MGLITHSLPPYSGPYQVSTHDLELPLPSSSSSSFSPALLKSTHQPALQLSTLLLTLFYPSSSSPSNRTNERMPWVERPLTRTAQGYARFLGKSPLVVKGIVWLFGRGIRLPVEMDLPLVDEGEKGNDKRRVVVFSHGLSGNRTTYSQYCGELASRGYIVAALEHRDGSGPITVVKLDDGTEKIVDYIKENDIYYPNPDDSVPFLKFRASQLLLRQAEISSLLSILSRINEGEGPSLELLNRRRNPSNSPFDFEGWKGRLNLDDTVMAGHSFGGATTIQVLRNNSSFTPSFKSGIALDPWADPIPPASTSPTSSSSSTEIPSALNALPSDSSETLTTSSPSPVPPKSPSTSNTSSKESLEIDVPFLTINSEAFTLWKPHFYLIRQIVTRVENHAKWFFTILGSVHLSFSDLPLILPGYLSSKKQTTPPLTSHSLIVRTSLEFLDRKEGEVLGGQVRKGDEEYVNPDRGEEGKGPLRRDVEKGEGYERMHIKGNFD